MRSPRIAFGLAALAALLTLTPAPAQSWTGAATSSWGDPNNWSPATVPGSGNTATFNAASPNTAVDLGGVGRPIGSILFDTAGAAGYTFSGNPGDAFVFDAGGGVTV